MISLNQSDAQYKKMMETPIPRLIASLSIPTVVSSLITVIYNTADTYFVSQIDKSASAAVGAVFSIMSIIQALGFGLGVGAGSLISRRLGAKDNAAADKYASSAFFASITVGSLIMVLGLLFLEPILRFLGCTDTMMPHAIPYARFILIAAPLNCATFVLNTTLRSEGLSLLSMVGITTGGLLNMALDPILINGFDMGTGGAAIATMASQIVSFTILFSFFLFGKSIVKINIKSVSRHFKDYAAIVTTGIPTIFRQGLASVASAALNIQAIEYGGDAAGAAMTIANKVYMLVRNIIVGLGQGFQPAAGYNYGAGNKKRTWECFTFAIKVGTVICLVFGGFSALFAKEIMWFFCDDAEVAVIGTKTLYFLCACIPFMAFSTFVNQLYQGLGFKLQATFLASCRQGIFFLPVIWLLPLFIDLTGVQSAQSIADICTFFISIPFIIIFYKKYIKETTK
ncbi:MAG: MATE family efflux transporter [Clostridia bacterium]|nr:MATE family efflux transporter [Clostridia bacterium]